jgi:hypothetical protein
MSEMIEMPRALWRSTTLRLHEQRKRESKRAQTVLREKLVAPLGQRLPEQAPRA